jgi:DNA-binding transcriptional MerR regulator
MVIIIVKLFSVGNFAKLARTTLHTLRYYDEIGLLSPEVRDKNSYRYYSVKQLAVCNLIRFFQMLGVPLAEINSLKDKRTPNMAKERLANQIKELSAKKERIEQAQRLLNTMLETIESGLDADETEITIQELPSQQIVLGERNDYSEGRTDYDALYSFYQTVKQDVSDYELFYPVWGIFTAERIINGDWNYPDYFYFFSSEGQQQRPAALYAVGYMRTGYGKSAQLFKRMLEYIGEKGYEVCGNTYEEYPLNEICVTDKDNYLLRVLMTVRKKFCAKKEAGH